MSDETERDLEQADEPAERDQRAGRGQQVAHEAEEYEYVDDRVSKWWVVLMVGAFVAILLYGLLLGRGGMLNPKPTPSPSPTASASPTVVVSPSPGVTLSPSPVLSPLPTITPTVVPSQT